MPQPFPFTCEEFIVSYAVRARVVFAIAVCIAVCAAAVLLLDSTPVLADGSTAGIAPPRPTVPSVPHPVQH